MVRIYIPDQTPEYAKLADTSDMSLEALFTSEKDVQQQGLVWGGCSPGGRAR